MYDPLGMVRRKQVTKSFCRLLLSSFLITIVLMYAYHGKTGIKIDEILQFLLLYPSGLVRLVPSITIEVFFMVILFALAGWVVYGIVLLIGLKYRSQVAYRRWVVALLMILIANITGFLTNPDF